MKTWKSDFPFENECALHIALFKLLQNTVLDDVFTVHILAFLK